MLYIGLSGPMLGGKGTVKEIIESKYKTYSISLSDIVREETRKRGLELIRDNLANVADDLRYKHGPGILAELAIKKVISLGKEAENYEIILFDSIRNPFEVKEFRQTLKKYFFLIYVDAPLEIRYERLKKRRREGEEILSFEEFKKKSEEEFLGREDRKIVDEGSDHPEVLDYGVNLIECLKRANARIVNDKSREELERQVISIIEKRKEEIKSGKFDVN